MGHRFKGERCHWCRRALEAPTSNGRLAATKDHVIPRRAGGRQIVLCCRFCNNLKGGVPLQVWLEFMVSTPLWWTRGRAEDCDRFRRLNHSL